MHMFSLNLARITIFHIFTVHRKTVSPMVDSLKRMDMCIPSLSHDTPLKIISTHLPNQFEWIFHKWKKI